MRASGPAAKDGASSLPLSVVWSRLAKELEALGQAGVEIEHSLCVLVGDRKADDALASDVQRIDHLLQHIEALRIFADAMAKQPKGQAEVRLADALHLVTLGAVRARLGGGEIEHEPGTRVDVELF